MGWYQEDHNVYFFKAPPPTLETLIEQVHQRTGLLPMVGASDAFMGESFVSLTNPQAEQDSFELYHQADFVRLTTYRQADYLTLATLHTLIALGGYCAEQLPQWPTKRWCEVADRVKDFPYHDRPDWVWD